MNTKIMSAVIVDDEPGAIQALEAGLKAYDDILVVDTQTNEQKARRSILRNKPDILFMDVEMPGISGIDLIKEMRPLMGDNTHVVFYTAYDKYLIDALRASAFDYLLKPPSPQDLAQTMTRFYEDKLASLPQAAGPAEQRQPRILVVNAMNEHIALRDADVAFFRFDADGKHWEAVCTNGSTYILRSRTNSDFILRYSPSFVQIHKRYIVNGSHIMMIQDNTCILGYPYEDNRELKVSKNYRRDLMDAFYTL